MFPPFCASRALKNGPKRNSHTAEHGQGGWLHAGGQQCIGPAGRHLHVPGAIRMLLLARTVLQLLQVRRASSSRAPAASPDDIFGAFIIACAAFLTAPLSRTCMYICTCAWPDGVPSRILAAARTMRFCSGSPAQVPEARQNIQPSLHEGTSTSMAMIERGLAARMSVCIPPRPPLSFASHPVETTSVVLHFNKRKRSSVPRTVTTMRR